MDSNVFVALPELFALLKRGSELRQMITKIEIDGYKSFERFSLELRPFTVVAGVNAVGKSNLFDALRHLSQLISKTLREAFETERGSLFDLFTIYPDGSSKDTISYAVEMLLPEYTEDQFSVRAELKYRRLRYELAIAKDRTGKLSIKKERLIALKRSEDAFLKQHKHLKAGLPKLTGGRPAFIDTEGQQITISQDGKAGNKRTVSLAGAQRTVLSSITTVEFPHAYAAKRLLEDIHFLQLNPEKLRQPSKLSASPYLAADGENLAAMIARLHKGDRDVLQMISNDLAMVVPSVGEVFLRQDDSREEYVVGIKHVDGYPVPSKLLSDGTLRILALIAIGYDPEFSGIIILEEPENGVHPGRVPEVVALLKGMTDISEATFGSRQVIANTHSILLIDCVKDKALVVATPKKIVNKAHGSYLVTEMSYVDGELISGRGLIAREQLRQLLSDRAPVGAL
jgi:predicted ATPase